MRISDWSSDVCSSDLLLEKGRFDLASAMQDARIGTVNGVCQSLLQRFCFEMGMSPELRVLEEQDAALVLKECVELALEEEKLQQIGRASCRERVCQYV